MKYLVKDLNHKHATSTAAVTHPCVQVFWHLQNAVSCRLFSFALSLLSDVSGEEGDWTLVTPNLSGINRLAYIKWALHSDSPHKTCNLVTCQNVIRSQYNLNTTEMRSCNSKSRGRTTANIHPTTTYSWRNEQFPSFSGEDMPVHTAKNGNWKRVRRAANTRKGAKIMMLITSSSTF